MSTHVDARANRRILRALDAPRARAETSIGRSNATTRRNATPTTTRMNFATCPRRGGGFAGMVLTTLAFALWLFAVFASEDALERVGAPSGKA